MSVKSTTMVQKGDGSGNNFDGIAVKLYTLLLMLY